MAESNHQAKGPALGYYYQSIYALIELFKSDNNNAFVSIETWDDVYLEDGSTKKLIQLKHSINENSKISIKSTELWRTIHVWCDYLKTNEVEDGIFTLSTVASIDEDSSLRNLKYQTENRDDLIKDLLSEAERVIKKREKVKAKNKILLKSGKQEESLPFTSKYKGCQSFISLTPHRRNEFVKKIKLVPDSFQVQDANYCVIDLIKNYIPTKFQKPLADSILAWWEREAVKSLCGERSEYLYKIELQEFISRKNAELLDDGFTNDLNDIDLPKIESPHPIQKQQLEIISATSAQKRRSYDTEMKARIQRDIWINNSLPSAKKLEKYDEKLSLEWSYQFEDMKDKSFGKNDEEKKEDGRILLDWSHEKAHMQISSISKNYNEPDLIRGSFQILSAQKRLGWHCDFINLISEEENGN
ncbi:hypothetical protein LDL79_16405 [Leeuwenhoekiella palythoae]|uniref:ABC-three component system protein n=1 Tax=Leeuwenhoekiella palythoae TaxID=573501 RepID=UPI001CE0A0EC|nr:ABC-three component system protein [Leeuwenhoekiella palythoae]UBZ10366.1 hypothetical protein LDL79_16405 [Leeuwenhoekiella palythoae]